MGEEEIQAIAFLEGLTPADFARVLVRFPGADSQVSEKATHFERVANFVTYARSARGPGIARLLECLGDLFPCSAIIQEYLQSFLEEMEATIAQMDFLSLRETPGAVRRPSRIRKYIPLSPLQPGQQSLPPVIKEPRIFNSFQEAFQEQEGRVLLLGVPGGGKTTTLLQFACDAAQACLRDPTLPIPIFQSVHGWDHQTPLVDWAQASIKAEFPDIDLANRPLLYIFDGLDELGGERLMDTQGPEGEKPDLRLMFLQAVAEQLPRTQIVISCRQQVYNQLKEKAILRGAVMLLPLTAEQIELYLRAKNQHHLWRMLSADANLLELAGTPLLLALLSHGVNTDLSVASLDISSVSANSIFDFYIRKRFEHEAHKRHLPFNEQITRVFLGKLGAAHWERWQSSLSINFATIVTVLGEQGLLFVDFACSMNFLRMSSDAIQFIHLKFRDFCALPALIEALYDPDYQVRRYAVEALGRIGDASAVPVLVTVLEDTTDQYIRQLAVIALAHIGDVSAVPALIEALYDPDYQVRKYAVETLAHIGDVSAVPALIELLQDSDRGVRTNAVEALGKIRDASAVSALVEALYDPNDNVRTSAIASLMKIGATAIPTLIDALKHDNANVLSDVIKILGHIGDASAVPALIELLQDTDESVRRMTVIALGQIGDVFALQALVRLFKDPDQRVRRLSVIVAQNIGDASVVPSLIAALQHTSANVRRDAVETLADITDASAVFALIEALSDPDFHVRASATASLMRKGSNANPTLIKALQHANANVRRNVVEVLANIGDTSAVPALIEALKDADNIAVRNSIEALAHIVDASAVPALTILLQHKKANVRRNAIEVMGLIGDASAIPALIRVLEDNDRRVRRLAIIALAHIGDASAVPALIAALYDPDYYVRGNVIEALGHIGDVSAVPALVELLQDSDESVRTNAVEALRQIRDVSAIPALVETLNNEDEDVRWNAVALLGSIGHVAAVPALIEALRDTEWSVRRKAAEALEQIGQEAIPALAKALNDDDGDVRWNVANTIKRLSDSSS